MTLNLDKSAWKTVAFGDVIENVTDRVDDPSQAGVHRYVGLEHLDPGVMTVQRWDTPDKVQAQKLRFQPGDVIFGRRRAYQKKVALAKFEGICSAHALVLRARPDYIDPDFLPVFLSSDYFLNRAIEISVGSLSPTVNWRDLKVQEFDLPALDEQKRIADLLWVIEQHRSALVEQAAELRSTFAVTALKQFDEAAGIECRIVDLCTSVIGGVWGVPAGEGEVDVLALGPKSYAGDVVFVDPEGSPTRSITRKQAAGRVLREGDIVLERSGGSLTQPVGRVIIAGPGLPDTVPTDFQRLLRPDSDRIEPAFLFWKLRLDWLTGVSRDYERRTTNISNLAVPDYLARSLKVPPKHDQLALIERVDQFIGALRKAEAEIETVSVLRGSLLAEVFGGV